MKNQILTKDQIDRIGLEVWMCGLKRKAIFELARQALKHNGKEQIICAYCERSLVICKCENREKVIEFCQRIRDMAAAQMVVNLIYRTINLSRKYK